VPQNRVTWFLRYINMHYYYYYYYITLSTFAIQQTPDVRYTYCPEYHHSMTFVPVNLKSLKMSEEKASQDAWKTSDGWIYPGKKTMLECNIHPRKLHEARAEDIQQVYC